MVKLSIIMPNYNYGHYLEEAIQSIATSTYPSFEIVLVDDGSTDDSVAVAEKLVKRIPTLRFFKNEVNKGIFETVAKAVALSKGTYLHFFASDDYRLPGFIEKTMKVLEEHPKIPLCCSDHIYVHVEQLNDLRCSRLLKTPHPYHIFSADDLKLIFRRSNFWIPGHTTIVKKETYLKYGAFNERLSYHCDWFLLHNIALFEGAAYLPEKLAVMRCHSHSYSAQEGNLRKKKSYTDMFQWLQENPKTEKAFLHATLLREMTKTLFIQFFFSPKRWIYFYYLFVKSFEYRLAKKLKIKINQSKLDKLNKDIQI